MMKRLTLAVATATSLLAGACVQQDDTHPVAKVLPTSEQVRIKLPDSARGKLAAVGQTSEWYVATRDITRTLNGGTAFVLILVHTIVQFPPTSVDGDVAVWGPHHDALDPAEWRLTVTTLADGTYDWTFDGRSRTAAGAQFETIVDGNAHGDGTGSFHLDFDAAERVNPIDNDASGQLDVAYDLPARTLDLGADRVEDRGGTPTAVHTDYAYHEGADGSGDMTFAIHGDTDDPGTAAEDITLRSRWQATGAGRADLRARSGDLAAEVTGSECWDTMFAEVYYTDSANWRPTEGAASACVFADVDLP